MDIIDSQGNVVGQSPDDNNVYLQAQEKGNTKDAYTTEYPDVLASINKALYAKGQELDSTTGRPTPIRTDIKTNRLEDPSLTLGEGLPLNTSPYLNRQNVFTKTGERKEPDDYPSLGLTVDEIVADKNLMRIVSEDMHYRTGLSLKNTRPEELTKKWLSGKRVIDNLNLWYVATDQYRLLSASQEEKDATHRGNILFDLGKGGMFQQGTTTPQAFSGIVDTTWSLITDPTTAFGLGVGSLAKRAALQKSIEKISKEGLDNIVKKTFKKAKIPIKKGQAWIEAVQNSRLSKREQKEIIDNVNQQSTMFTRNTVNQLSKAEIKERTKKGFYAAAKGVAVTEAGLTGIADFISQKSDALVDPDYKYSKLQTAISAGGGMLSGVFELVPLFMGTLGRKGINESYSFNNYMDLKAANTEAAANMNVKQAVDDIGKQWLNIPDLKQIKIKFNSFYDKAKKGAPLRYTVEGQPLDASMAARVMFMAGDEEVGFKGLIPILRDLGITYGGPRKNLPIDKKTGKPIKDNFANWLFDVVKSMPSEVRKEIDEGFQASVGRFVPDYKGKTLTQALDMDAAYAREAGVLLNQYSQAWNVLYKADTQEELNKALVDEFDVVPSSWYSKVLNDVGWFQRQVIRAVVTHPGTTALNVFGWKTATSIQSASDLGRAFLYGRGDKIGRSNAREISDHIASVKYKMSNMLDPAATADRFEDLMTMFPDESKELLRYMFLGIEREDEIAKAMGVGYLPKVVKDKTEMLLDKAQMIYGVRAVDFMTKQQELMYAIDKLSRRHYNMSYSELLQSPDIVTIIDSGEFVSKVYSPAIVEARKNTFSMKFGATKWSELNQPVKQVAKIIEDARKIPLVGLMIPFGQFFNNTMSFMFDTMGLSTVHRYFVRKSKGMTKAQQAELTKVDPVDLNVKAAVGFAMIGGFAISELKNKRNALGLFEERDRSGQIVDNRYNFPESLYRGLGRIIAHGYDDGWDDIPRGLIEDVSTTLIGSTFEPLSGSLNDFNQNIYDILSSGDDREIWELAKAFGRGALGSPIQMISRPMEPINSLTQLMSTEFQVNDKKQNVEFVNNTLRYVDEIYQDLFDIELAPKKYIAGQERDVAGAFNYGKRAVAPHGVFFEMMNMIGEPRWKTGNTGPFADVNNRLNQIISIPLNRIAEEYVNRPEWVNGNNRQRKKVVNTILSRSKAYSKDLLETAINRTGNPDARLGRLVKMYRLGKTENNIRDAIKLMAQDDASYLQQDADRLSIPVAGEFLSAPIVEPKDLTEEQMDAIILILEARADEATEIRSIGDIFPKIDRED